MRLDIVGSAGTFPAPGRPASGYIVTEEGTRVWCDAGPGTFMSLPIDDRLIDAVVISHRHVDHCADLLAAFHAWRFCPEPRHEVPVYAPESVFESIKGFLRDVDGVKIEDTLAFRPVAEGDIIEVGPLTISFTTSDHSVPTVASRWSNGSRSMFYTGDTGAGGEWASLAKGVDLMLCEASYQGEPGVNVYPHHLTASEAGRIAREQEVGQLVLTHIPPYLDPTQSVAEAEPEFDRPVALAVPGGQFKI